MKLLIAFSCLLAFAMASNDLEWESFKIEFNRTYVNATEEAYRKQIFLDNKMSFDEHNRLFDEGKVTFTVGIHQFADMTNEEYREKFISHKIAIDQNPCVQYHKNTGVTPPSAVDWSKTNNRKKQNCVTPVKNRKNCKSCWAFSTTGSVESINCINTGKLVELSEQQLIDCSKNGNTGCNGGHVDRAYEYIISEKGLYKEKDYEYEARKGKCRVPKGKEKSRVTIDTFYCIHHGNEKDLLDAVTQQPVAAAIYDIPMLIAYTGSVITPQNCTKPKGKKEDWDYHDVLVVGFGTENGVDYWIVKNSEGPKWGEIGYFRLERNRNTCGIADEALYPTQKLK